MVDYNKKAISPVVATALLLVVAVVAVVSFQTWFNTYQSGLTVKVEEQSDSSASLTVERLEGTTTATIYVKNVATTAVQVNSVRVVSDGSTLCTNSTAFNSTASTVTTTTVGSCTMTSGESYNVVLVSDEGVFSETEITR